MEKSFTICVILIDANGSTIHTHAERWTIRRAFSAAKYQLLQELRDRAPLNS